MVFTSIIFLCGFLPLVLLFYFTSYKFVNLKVSNIILLIFSLFFMLWGSGKDILIMIEIILINYIAGLLLTSGNAGLLLKGKKTKYQKTVLVFTIILNLGMLGYYKYAGFVFDTTGSLLNMLNVNIETPSNIKDILLPLGISFYTFQAMSYTFDVYFGNVEATRNLVNFSLYVSLFPQIIAGPIVRYKDIYKQIEDRTVDYNDVYIGIKRFMVGFAKKVLLANTVAVTADNIFALPIKEIHFGLAWIGIIAYSLQIFLDFSAYSDMAIGLGRIFGFHLLENFNYPYIAKSVQDFWRRWHISLSSWFKDYLYIPLGGNRKGNIRTYFNLVIVFTLCGLWHGAAWIFIAWGLWHGIFLVIERLFLSKLLRKVPAFFRHIYTLLVVAIGWVFFRSSSMHYAITYIKKMLYPFAKFDGNIIRNASEFLHNDMLIAATFGILLSGGLFKWIYNRCNESEKRNIFEVIWTVLLLGVFLLSIASLYNGSYNPFIYFRF